MTDVALLSFDIDGTLEIGDPPGIIPVALVRRAKALGYLVGSCSDRPVSFQQAMCPGVCPPDTVCYGEPDPGGLGNCVGCIPTCFPFCPP